MTAASWGERFSASERKQKKSRSRVHTGRCYCRYLFSMLATLAVMQRFYDNIPTWLGLSSIGILHFFILCLTPVMLHPQCLDFKPPFRPLRELEFCTMYKDFGCCDYQKDQELLTKYYQIMDNLDSQEYISCAGFVLELLCQVSVHGQRSLGIVQMFSCDQTQNNFILNKHKVTCHYPWLDFLNCKTEEQLNMLIFIS